MADSRSSESIQDTIAQSYEAPHPASYGVPANKDLQPSSTDSKGVAGHHLEKGVSHREHVDLNQNLEARIKNPLEGIPRDELISRVEVFAQEKGLTEHVALLRRGALVAQDPSSFDEIDGPEALNDDEKAALRTEAEHKWRLPMKLYLTIATCSIGAAVQGWDQTGSNGANIFFPTVYGIAEKTTRDTLLVGLINAGPYIGSAFIGCWLSDPINNLLGRRGVIFVSAHFCLWPVIGSAFCHTWEQQLACRILMGIGMGVKASTVPIYAAENSPAAIRGALVMSWPPPRSTYVQRFVELFTVPRVRRATLAAFTVMIAQQMCGINIIAFYSSTIFKDNGSDEFHALLASFGFGLINWVFAFPAFWTIDTFGRRSLLLFTFPQMMWTLLAAGCARSFPLGTTRTALVALFVYLFAAFYSPAKGPAEVFPLSHREVGMGFAVATCLFWAAVLSMTLGSVGAFGLYAGFNFVALVMIFFWVPETKQRTLEELDYVFAVTEALPWFVKRWVFWQRKAELRPLYHFDQEKRAKKGEEVKVESAIFPD
ncbi:hypothetical protein NEMBOFW57_010370 [Staphylotrichum longicolle]|uniref:Major facilitator superfamily (MFS) profile domain-containing protein n=1 Tax=Staphylotrichum longicolle TaxID=669026 RepID=A0AAD4HUA5_9PEZI|nr:hypothetical protein NEMBOFW57_010370 [Staphylotrichum longicolle]